MSEDITPVSSEVANRRRRLKTAKRDELGFVTEAMPHLTAQQVKWIAHRAQSSSNHKACEESGIELFQVLEWMEQPDFLALYTEVMENKREGFKQLATQLLPQALLTLQNIMVSGEKDADRIKATNLLLRNQGLLVDKATVVDKDALTSLLEEMRRPRPVIKVLPNPREVVDGESSDR